MTTFSSLRALAQNSVRILFPVARRCWAIVFISSFLFRFLDQYFIWLGDQNDDTAQIFVKGLSLILSLVFSVWISLLIPYHIHRMLNPTSAKATLSGHLQHFSKAMTLESLRAFGNVSLGFIFFIVPGVVLFFRYYFVSFVVQFDPQYEEGKVQALNESKRLWVNGRKFYVFLVIVFLFCFDCIWSYLTADITIFSRPIIFTLLSMVDVVIEILTASAGYLLYVDLKKQLNEAAQIKV